jgi:ketosteroid isomerase-like protein
MTDSEIHTVLERLTHAELTADVTALDSLTTDDMTLVGPLGFVLEKSEWLDRHRSGALTTEVLAWQPESLRRHHDMAIVIGTQDQQAHYQGHPVQAHLRATHVLLHLDAGWRVASTHLSPMGEPPAFARAPEPAARPNQRDPDHSSARPR